MNSPAKLAEGKKYIDPVAVSDYEDADDGYLLDLELYGLIDNEIKDALEWFINLPDSDAPGQKQLSYDYICEQQKDDRKILALQSNES